MSMPIVALAALDAAAIEAHLLRLDAAARSLRFTAGVVTDEAVRRYVNRLDFSHDAVLGVVDAIGQVIALAHGAVYMVADRTRIEAAFSVDEAWRRQGLATALMKTLERFAEESGAEALIAMCMARNLPMRRVFERTGMTTVCEEGEVHAQRSVSPMATARAAA